MIKAVFFDLDDTLFDYEYAHQKALAKVFTRINRLTKMKIELIALMFELAQKEVKMQLAWTAASHNRDLYFQKFFEKMNLKCKNAILPKTIIEIYDLYWSTFFAAMKRETRSKRTLQFLRRKGIKVWIITDSITYTQLKKLAKLNLSEDIDFLITSEEAGTEKPHSWGFLLACHKAGVLTSEALMVGDNIERDIDGAQWVWMKGIWINRYGKKSKGINPYFTVNTTKDLYILLQDLLS